MTQKNELATKQDVQVLRSEMNEMEERMMARMENSEDRMMNHMKESEKRIMRHFDVVAEDMFEKLNGANADQISAHGNKLNEHHERIDRLEQLQGIA